jgi:CPA2 family monovalent cation:H+ antiporter-2
MRRVIRIIQTQREARYDLLRGYFHGTDDDESVHDMEAERLTTFTLPPGAKVCGSAVQRLGLSAHAVRLVQLRRASGINAALEEETLLQEGDTLVLSGSPEHLAVVVDALSKGA